MGPDLHILDTIIISVSSSICYTQTNLPKITSCPKQDQLHISPLNNTIITQKNSDEYFKSILTDYLSSCPVGIR